MAVQTTNNKPINPRGNDQSPKGYNRAALYSGKALDFDGVNDKIDVSFAFSGNTTSISFYLNWDAYGTSNVQFVCESQTGSTFMVHLGGGAGTNGIRFSMSGTTFDSPNAILSGYNHYTLTTDNTTASLYVNGKLFNSKSVSLGSAVTTSLAIAYRSDGNILFLNGQLSGFKIFNTALTAAQVSDLYNNPEKIVPTGVEDTALKLWLPMMEGAGTTCINGAPDALGSDVVTNGDFATDSDWTKGTGWSIGSGVASCDGTQTGNTGLNQSNTLLNLTANEYYYIQYDISNYVAGTINPHLRGTAGGNVSGNGTKRAIIKAGTGTTYGLSMYASSTFDADIDNIVIKEISNVGEISGATWTHGIGAPVAQTAVIDWNKHTYNVSTETLVPQGLTAGRDLLGNLFENVRKQGALNLDGNSWAEVHDNASLDVTTGVSVETWLYNYDGDAFTGVLGKWDATTDRSYAIIKNNASDNFLFRISTDGSNQLGPTVSVTTYGWIHLVMTYDGTTIRSYLNGVADNTSAQSGNIYTSDFPLEIGQYDANSATRISTQIAQPRIYNRALTAEEVERNYNAGKNIYK
jgi:hypothetical protein